MKKLVIALLLVISPVADAVDLDSVKIEAQKLDLVYIGVSEEKGKTFYQFHWTGATEVLVDIPADIQDDRDAAVALEAGFASAMATYAFGVLEQKSRHQTPTPTP